MILLGLMLDVPAIQAAPPHYSDTFPLSKVRPGMTGYGLTTFKGTAISRFNVTILGVLRKMNQGHDLILVKLSGGPLTERHANLVQGMSGSPIYLRGKVVGAFSAGEPFVREPIGYVTPIDDMLEAWDPNIPQQPNFYQPADLRLSIPQRASRQTGSLVPPASAPFRRLPVDHAITLPHPIRVGERRIARLILAVHADDPRRSSDDTVILHPATQYLSMSGINERTRVWLQQELDRHGYPLTVTAAPSVGGIVSDFKGAPIRPGSAIGAWLSTGDILTGGTGTATYRKGNRILAFGHPLFSLGSLDGAFSSAYILDIVPSYQTSHHTAIPGPMIGALRQDRDFAISAELGTEPTLVPLTVHVFDHTLGQQKTFHVNLFRNPDITPLLMRAAARELITRVHDMPGDVMADVTTVVDAGEVGRISRTNRVFDAADVAAAATADLGTITDIVSGNPFYPLPIHHAEITIDIRNGHNTASVERIFLKQGRIAPGDTLQIGVEIKPYRRESILRSLALKVPSDTPSGRYTLVVRGGTPTVTHLGPFVISAAPQDTHTAPVNVRQMVNRLNERDHNTDLVAQILLNSATPALQGEKLSQMPPNLAALMRSDRDSGVRLERDEVHSVQSTDFVISGVQQLLLNVQRKETQEPAGRSGTDGSAGSLRTSSGLTLPGLRSSVDPADTSIDTSAETSLASPLIEKQGNRGEPATEMPVASFPMSPLMQTWLEAATGESLLRAGAPPQASTKNRSKDPNLLPANKKSSVPVPDAPQRSAGHSATGPLSSSSLPDKPINRPLTTWRQEARLDFAAGKFTGTSVTANGELRLAPRLHRLFSTGETYIWSLVSDAKGNLYAGTGSDGKIFKVDPQGHSRLFATLPTLSVQSLLLDKEGTLWAGSGVQGQLYRLRQDGSYTLVCTLPGKYIVALAQDSKGALYIGAGSGGTVYRLAAGSETAHPVIPEAYLRTTADHIMAMSIDAGDNLYVGTGNNGILYKVTPDGKSRVLYDARENAITALASASDGSVYAGTGPKGLLYRIAPDGTAAVIYDRVAGFYTALQAAPDGSLYAASVTGIYHVLSVPGADLQPVVQPLDNPEETDFLSLAVLPGSGVAAGTGNVGDLYTSQPTIANDSAKAGAGIYESPVHDAKLSSRWGEVRLDADLPAGAILNVETRTGNVGEPDATWSQWARTLKRRTGEAAIASSPGRFIQYRLLLDGSAAVRAVSLSYMPRNQAPHVSFQAPLGGERWSKSQTIRWNADDPDNDTLTYDLFYSTNGTDWAPLSGQGKTTSAAGDSVTRSLDEIKRKLDNAPEVPDGVKKLLLDSAAKRMLPANDSVGSLRQTSKTWDTATLPDGTYRLKVVASDRVSDPVDPLTAQALSDPFVICNTLPTLTLGTPLIGKDGLVTLQGVATQPLIEVTAVQYHVDGGDWIAAAAKDGLFDTSQEEFLLSTLPLKSGRHTLEVVAYNAAGGKTAQTITVTVP